MAESRPQGETPEISVIVPVYGAEDYLDRCVSSVLEQEVRDFELILVNDCSPDRSGELMEAWAARDARIRTKHLPQNVRQGGARNRGLDMARGRFIYFLDSDDWILPGTFRALLEAQAEHDADLVGFEYRRARTEGELYDDPHVARVRERLLPLAHGGVLSDREHSELLLHTAGVANNLYRRSLIEEAGLRFPEGLSYEDNAFVKLVTLYVERYAYLPEAYYCYYGNPQSTTQQINSEHQFDRLEVEDLKLREFEARGFRERYRDAIDFDFLRLYYLNSLGIFFRRDEIPWARIRAMREHVHETIPDIRKNPYFKTELRRVEKLKYWLSEHALPLLALLYRVRG